ncbi:MAG TPA: ATP phosphoribosyltransferase regulatory subunit, partial [Candidatus Limnocylindria bacterium]|nr:ATP phosphoribosyltransferase regulatory subunit [Candidatus Limnocylindria bacterium]
MEFPQRLTPAPPRGFRDILPTEARELRAIEHALTTTFTAYGYMPLEPPMVEHTAGESILAGDRLIQFLDRDGSLVALRPDITTAVARLVAQRYADTSGALRLSYFAPVFREEPAMLGAEREFSQAGVELVGPSGPLADAEALALLAESLARAGLRDETIEIGHVGVVRALFSELAEDARELVMRELRDGDHVGAFRRAREGGMNDAALMRARSAL